MDSAAPGQHISQWEAGRLGGGKKMAALLTRLVLLIWKPHGV